MVAHLAVPRTAGSHSEEQSQRPTPTPTTRAMYAHMRAEILVVGVDGIGDAGAVDVLALASSLGVASLAPDPDAISLPLLSILLLFEILDRVFNYLST